jgi:copper chaperone CopZ
MKALILSSVSILAMAQVACAASASNKTTTTATTTSTSTAVTTTPSAGGGFVEDKLTFKVTGMHCGGCASSIKTELEKMPGVAEAQVDFKTGEVVVISSGPGKLERGPLVKTIEAAGTFKVKK